MDPLRRQVARVQRRMNVQIFLVTVVWTLFGGLSLAAVAIAARKIWPLAPHVSDARWAALWLTTGVLSGLLVAGFLTGIRRRNRLEAAIELDRRFGLRERISSTLSLSADQRRSDAGVALVDDAMRRVQRIELSDQFRIGTDWHSLLLLLPAVIAFGLMMFVPSAKPREGNQARGSTTAEIKKRITNTTKNLQKNIAERRELAQKKGLPDASQLFGKLEKDVDRLKKTAPTDRKKAMIKLNNLADQIRERKRTLGDRQSLKQQLGRLSDIKSGPADELARAMKQGDLRKSLEEIDKLRKQLASDPLSPSELESLREQMRQMAEKMQQVVDAHDRAKRQLEEQIQRKLDEGDKVAAGQLQRKLDALNDQNQRLRRMQQMAQQLQECSECIGRGQNGQASSQLGDLSSEIAEMQQEIDELEMLDEALDGICQAKDSMNCDSCLGAGCSMCQGDGFGNSGGFDNSGQTPGMGLGAGQGFGDRPEEATEQNYYPSQVRGNVGKGRAVLSGEIDGPNIAGDPREEVRLSLETARTGSDDPLTQTHLPRSQRAHSRQYFDAFRSP